MCPSSSMMHPVGRLIAGRFQLEALAGSGGMGTVYRARDLLNDRPAAIKLLQSGTGPGDGRFAQEAALLATLSHPGIVRYIAHGVTPEGQNFLAMEWLEGEDLSVRLRRGPLPLSSAVTLLRRVAEALAMAHGRGVVHRDLKPANLFLRRGLIERVTLLDFGIAHHAEARAALTRTGVVLGTPEYMSPEQARGQREISPAADIFSLGCVIYECVTGRPPFLADHIAATLAKVLFDELRPARALRPDVPEELDSLLGLMLAKSPQGRLVDAAALLRALQALDHLQLSDAEPVVGTPSQPPALTDVEQFLLSIVVATPTQARQERAQTLRPDDLARLAAQQQALAEVLGAFRLRAEWLVNGTLVAALEPGADAHDQVAQAARCALLLRERWPEAQVALATGYGRLRETSVLGEVLDRALRLLDEPAADAGLGGDDAATAAGGLEDGVRVDELSASLLDNRFLLLQRGPVGPGGPVGSVGQGGQGGQGGPGGRGMILAAERTSLDETRPLLGAPTPCVGREQELAVLEACLSGCLDDSVAAAVLVTAPTGVGKSRLRHEFLRRARTQHPELKILVARGDALLLGAPYGMLAQLVRALCDLGGGEPHEVQRAKLQKHAAARLPSEADRVAGFLGEALGVPFPLAACALLGAARSEPKILGEQVQAAVIDLLRAECAAAPLLLILEDLHFSDALTVRLLDAVLRELSDQPLLILGTARTELAERFPSLWGAHRVQHVALRGLSKKACERLVQAVLPRIPSGSAAPASVGPATVQRIIDQAGGNPLLLEELLRAVASGKGEALPETVLAVLQARFAALPHEVRRALRAASVFGQVFWRGGLLALTQGGSGGANRSEGSAGAELDEWLRRLVEAEIIEAHPRSRFADEHEYGFRHPSLREAAYALLTETDRQIGHRLAAGYLRRIGESDPAILGEHSLRGGESGRAARYFVEAAQRSFAASDPDCALARAEQAEMCGATGEELGASKLLRSLVRFYRGELPVASVLGAEALALLTPGGARWAQAIGNQIAISTLLGQRERLGELFTQFLSVRPGPGAHAAYIEGAGTQTVFASVLGRRELVRAFLERIEDWCASCGADDATSLGWRHHARAFAARYLETDPLAAMQQAERACAHFQRSPDLRWLLFARTVLGATQHDLGLLTEAEATLREALAMALRLRESFQVRYAQLYLAATLTATGRLPSQKEAAALLDEVLADPRLIPLYRGWGRSLLAQMRLCEGAPEAALKELTAALQLLQFAPAMLPFPLTLRLRALLGLRADEARLRPAIEALAAALRQLGPGGSFEVGAYLALGEAHAALGAGAAAREALERASAALSTRAQHLGDPALRERYLTGLPECRRVREHLEAQPGSHAGQQPGAQAGAQPDAQPGTLPEP
ncbi:MAG: protein kinase [Polyangia bacterium]